MIIPRARRFRVFGTVRLGSTRARDDESYEVRVSASTRAHHGTNQRVVGRFVQSSRSRRVIPMTTRGLHYTRLLGTRSRSVALGVCVCY